MSQVTCTGGCLCGPGATSLWASRHYAGHCDSVTRARFIQGLPYSRATDRRGR